VTPDERVREAVKAGLHNVISHLDYDLVKSLDDPEDDDLDLWDGVIDDFLTGLPANTGFAIPAE
jgi:hypothetical protein